MLTRPARLPAPWTEAVRSRAWLCAAAVGVTAVLLGCGGGSGGVATDATGPAVLDTQADAAGGKGGGKPGGGGGGGGGGGTTPVLTVADASRLAHQASFGPSEALIAAMRAQSAPAWVKAQMALNSSRYALGGTDAVHKDTTGDFCGNRANDPNCWRDWYSTTPLVWDFFRNATQGSDQLRQRVALALQQIVVVSGYEVNGTYGLRTYHNNLLNQAFGNYRQVLKSVALSPVMGDYLNGVNNHKDAPNENFPRELLQLFALGTCLLNSDGSLAGGRCQPVYDNATVRNYAYALTGWTYPAGGATAWGCWPQGANCRYYGGDMVSAPASFRDTQQRVLLSNQTVRANSTAPQALEVVLDSLMQHPNMGPFIGRQLIQHLVTSNPNAAYVQRVASAFNSGSFTSGGVSFGGSGKGDLAATVAAVLLDAEARSATPGANAGKLREPLLMLPGVLRALNGRSDGDAMGWWWGEILRQHAFRSPSVFNFYPPNYPVAGTTLNGPQFGIHNTNAALERLNYLTYLLFWTGSAPEASVPGAFGTQVDLSAFVADAGDAAKLVDRLSALAVGGPLPAAPRNTIITAVNAFTSSNSSTWQTERVRQAAYLVFAAPQYQIQR